MTLFDISGRVSFGITGATEGAMRSITRQLDPFLAGFGDAGAPDVLLDMSGAVTGAPIDVQNPARDGTTTTYDGRMLSLVAGQRSCSIEGLAGSAGITLRSDPDFPTGPLFRRLVRPALQTTAVRHDIVAVHSAAVEMDGRAILLAGWSESGKTETALALMEDGADWLTDKWTLVGVDAQASAFPVSVGVRCWVLPYLPTLAAALPRKSRWQAAVAGAVALAGRPLRRWAPRRGALGAAAAAADRVTGLLDRAALTQSEIRTAYGQTGDPARRIPLGTVVLLTTVPGTEVTVDDVTRHWAATRLAVTGAHERHDWFLLHDRLRYANPSLDGSTRERAIEAERRILERAFSDVQLLSVRAPFPVDPRRVADAIRTAW
jgi:hypothetical protein